MEAGRAEHAGRHAHAATLQPQSCFVPWPAERVKVFVRIRPTKAEGETAGAVKVKTDGKGLVIFRE